MGAAFELLSAMDREMIARDILSGVDDPKCVKFSKPGIVGAYCPFHSEATPGGAFRYDSGTDSGKCYGCGRWSDLIGIWNVTQGRDEDDPEGFKEFVKEFGKGAKLTPQQKRGIARSAPQVWAPKRTEFAPEIWTAKATAFATDCAAALQENESALCQLRDKWGIDADTARYLGLGWNVEDVFRKYTHWGLPYAENDKGRERCIYLPKGLVLPYWVRGQVCRIKIRKQDLRDERDLKYWEAPGSETRYVIYGNSAWRHWVVVETERDAALVFQEVRKLRIGAMACCGTGKYPDPLAHEILSRSELILVGVDNDEAGARMTWNFQPGASWRFSWMGVYPQAVRHPVPLRMGKDQGDIIHQLRIRDWVLAGLPEHTLRRLALRRRTEDFPEPKGAEYTQELKDLCAEARKQRVRWRVDGLDNLTLVWPVRRDNSLLAIAADLDDKFAELEPEFRKAVGI